jgi:trypsin
LSEIPLQNRFSGGSKADVGQFPFHTAVYRDDIYRCGGSLISESTVVTACHCVVNDVNVIYPKESFRLLFGAVDLKALSGSEALREVSEIIKHPDYQFDKILKQDIALAKIKGNLQFSSTIRPICLFTSQTPISDFVEQKFTVLGFGSNENSREPSQFLNYGKMAIITRQQCIESKLIFGLLPEQSAFCAKAVDSQIACPGDSGGELMELTLDQLSKYLLGLHQKQIFRWLDFHGKWNTFSSRNLQRDDNGKRKWKM